jgi:hypothetical protein
MDDKQDDVEESNENRKGNEKGMRVGEMSRRWSAKTKRGGCPVKGPSAQGNDRKNDETKDERGTRDPGCKIQGSFWPSDAQRYPVEPHGLPLSRASIALRKK